MTTIIAGRFDLQDDAARAVAEIERAGFSREHISSFYCNPAGMHAATPIGGDQDRSPGAEETPRGIAAGTATGGAVGAAVGSVGIPVLGPIAPIVGGLVGAHVGNLVGSASQMKDGEDADGGAVNAPARRRTGIFVAVGLPGGDQQNKAVDTLSACGAVDIEVAEGTIENSDWSDFDPVSSPKIIANQDHSQA